MKKIILFSILLALAFGGFYAWREYHRTRPSLSTVKPDVEIASASLINAFEKDTAAANRQYTDKIIAVIGKLKSIDDSQAPAVVFLSHSDELSTVRCVMDSSSASSYRRLKPGTVVTIKGRCTGGEISDMGLGTDVTLTNCVVIRQP